MAVATFPAEVAREPAVEPHRWRFTPEAFYRMAEVGILPAGPGFELIDGEIYAMSPIGPRHHGNLNRLVRLFRPVEPRAILSVQGPIRIDDHTEPQPDLMLLRPRDDFYTSAHPGPADVLLLVEVMDTSAAYDRGKKLGLYAHTGIAEVWLIDLNREHIEVYRRPERGLYAEISVRSRGQRVAPDAFPDLELEVNALLGEAEHPPQ